MNYILTICFVVVMLASAGIIFWWYKFDSIPDVIEGFLFFGSVLAWIAAVAIMICAIENNIENTQFVNSFRKQQEYIDESRGEEGFYYDFAKANAELAEKQASREFWGKYSTVPEEVLELKPLH